MIAIAEVTCGVAKLVPPLTLPTVPSAPTPETTRCPGAAMVTSESAPPVLL